MQHNISSVASCIILPLKKNWWFLSQYCLSYRPLSDYYLLCQECVCFSPLFSFQPFHWRLKDVPSLQNKTVFKSQLRCVVWGYLCMQKLLLLGYFVQPEILLFLRQKRGNWGFLALALALAGCFREPCIALIVEYCLSSKCQRPSLNCVPVCQKCWCFFFLIPKLKHKI